MAIQNYTRRQLAAVLDLVQPEVETFDLPTRKNPTLEPNEVNRMNPLLRYGHLKFAKMAAGRLLTFGTAGSSAI